MKRIHYIYIPILLGLGACSPNLDMVGMFYGQSPRNDVRFQDSMDYDKATYAASSLTEGELLGVDVASDTYKVYFGTDMHVDSTWRNTAKWATLAENDADCPFAIILGDMINAQGNFGKITAAVRDNLTKPVYATVGNHDLYWSQWTDYKQYWGSSTYYFVVTTPSAKDLYICLDSGDGTLGRDQLAWLKNTLNRADAEWFRHIIVFTHTHFFKRDSSQGHTSNFALEETYEIADVLGSHGVDWYVSGHAHSRAVSDFKGVKYIIVDTLQDPEPQAAYMVATVGNRLQYEFIEIN